MVKKKPSRRPRLDRVLPRSRGRLSHTLGFQPLKVGATRVEMRMPFSRKASQMAGMFHGGALAALADTAAAVGILAGLPEGSSTVTGELKINYLGNVHRGAVVAKAARLHRGRRTQVWEVRIYEEGTRRLLAVSTGTFFVFSPPKS